MALPYDNSLSASRLLSPHASISSLSDRKQASQIAKTYRQAAQLFLTRRLPEALSTIEPIIRPPEPDHANGERDGASPAYAPIATASRGSRIKVWSFYLTFLNAVVELGAEEGKHAFGSTKWKQLVQSCRDGSVWEEVVQDGYGGVQGDVDADVVINLATLLLTHCPTQTLNQRRLETYLSATAHPTFDISSHINGSSPSLRRRPSPNNGGTSTPRDLNTRLKLLELYTLHVLPRNEEWDYAREFISMSEVLDDERKEAFLLALHGLKEEKEHTLLREEELRRQQREQLEARRLAEEQARREAEEQERLRQREAAQRRNSRPQNNPDPRNNQNFRQSQRPGERNRPPNSHPRSQPNGKKSAVQPTASSLASRASAMLQAIQQSLVSTAQSMTANPMAMFRTLLFVLAFLLAFGRRDIRERIRLMVVRAWEKVRRTVGMGVKVSYI